MGALPIALAALALLGRLFTPWLLVDPTHREQDFALRIGTVEDERARLERALAEQGAAVGMVQELEARIVALRDEAQPLMAERDRITAELKSARQQLIALQKQTSTLEPELAARQGELQTVEQACPRAGSSFKRSLTGFSRARSR